MLFRSKMKIQNYNNIQKNDNYAVKLLFSFREKIVVWFE